MPAPPISSKPTAVLHQKERLYAESSVYSRSFLWFCKAKDQSPAVNGLLALVFCRGFCISSCCGSMLFQQAVLLLVNVDSSNAVGHSTVHQALSGGHVSSIADGQGAVCRQQVCGIDLGGASINGHLQLCAVLLAGLSDGRSDTSPKSTSLYSTFTSSLGDCFLTMLMVTMPLSSIFPSSVLMKS